MNYILYASDVVGGHCLDIPADCLQEMSRRDGKAVAPDIVRGLKDHVIIKHPVGIE